ncbi:SDR family NAD(P)-dependent oxidoreductase [Novosphingobium sp. fls2-241-R2A-195]|jgi:NAD(P)-dependent dehydrogenase (short-subunit alcohol dehydrogenase family)|uniref:SDR family NAD(P)-dependent oxidoreductase n=1 Tax=Novosphingobium sp. fls2-241-R2A-195 TaxID=3040296 RepID=UPI00254F5868|nr:SDR family NAD(P)-dependent oxidoreductase [Novosphingobium sp. fls2-241-R2A-195]
MRSILVTGAGSGIGQALVERCLSQGDRVIAAVRSDADLAALGAGPNLHGVRIDVSDTASVEAGFADADRWLAGQPLDVVVNCAAVCPLGAVEVQSEQVVLDTLNVNTVGSVRMLRAALPRLRGHGGRIALVTSLWGKVSGPMLSAYCASKFAIEAVVDAARRETAGQDARIILIEPGVVRTRMVEGQVAEAERATQALTGEDARLYQDLYRKYHAMIHKNGGGGVSAEECARQIDAAVSAANPRTRYKVGADAKAVTALARLFPDRALDRAFAMLLK